MEDFEYGGSALFYSSCLPHFSPLLLHFQLWIAAFCVNILCAKGIQTLALCFERFEADIGVL